MPVPTPPRSRRDVLTIVALSFAGTGFAASLWPFVDQMNPNRASPLDTVEVDVSPIKPGQSVTVTWKGQPVVVRHRTPEEIAAVRTTRPADLRDHLARNTLRPAKALATDENRAIAGRPQWLVVIALCTHLGCRLDTRPEQTGATSDAAFFCPCHAARFDAAGRVLSGPAPTNLPVPPAAFTSPTRLRIG